MEKKDSQFLKNKLKNRTGHHFEAKVFTCQLTEAVLKNIHQTKFESDLNHFCSDISRFPLNLPHIFLGSD